MARRGQRRSARISALEAKTHQGTIPAGGGPGGREEKGKQIVVIDDAEEEDEEEEVEEDTGQDSNSVQELPETKRGRKKRKLRTVEEVVVSSVERAVVEQQEPEIPNHELYPINTGQSSSVLPTVRVPEKRLLELILDILEERDWGKVFAEPVDPDDVEGYYEIITEPMDFGTMKTKLNEGMYTTLDAFKHDVFLVSGNAMHFNASNTYYFRQGFAINELAKRIFYTLKTDPEDYDVALSSLRIRRGRKPGSLSKISKNVRPNGTTNGVAPRDRPYSSYGSSTLRRNIQACTGPSSSSPHIDKKDYENHSGFKDGKKSNTSDEDSRQTFKPWGYFLNSQEAMSKMVYESLKQLVNVNEGGMRYSESLMTFVKDLGPVAQSVAKRKLQISQLRNCQIPAASPQQRSIPTNSIINIPASQNFPPSFSGQPTVNTCEKLVTLGGFREQLGHNSRSSGACVNGRNLNLSINGTPNSGNLRAVDFSKLDNRIPVSDLASKLSPTRLLEFICRRNNGCMPSSSHFQAMRESNSSQGSSSIHEVGAGSMPSSSRFQGIRWSGPSQASGSIHELGSSSMPSSSRFRGMRESNPSQVAGSIYEVGSSSIPSSSRFQAMMESDPIQASSTTPSSSHFQVLREPNPLQASSSIHEVGSSSMPSSSCFQGMRVSSQNQASDSVHEFGASYVPSSSWFQGLRESNTSQALGSIHEAGPSSMPSSSCFQGMRESNPIQASGSSTHELGSSSLSEENHAFSAPGSGYRVGPSQASQVPKWNQCSMGSHSLNGDHNQSRTEHPTCGTDSVMSGQVLEWNGCNMGSNSFGSKNLALAGSGPSHTVNSVEAEQVHEWNRSNSALHSLGGERNQAKVEETQVYMGNSSLRSQVLDWKHLSTSSNPFGQENLTMAKPGPSCTINSTDQEPLIKWNQQNLGTHYFGENITMASAPDPSCGDSLAETEQAIGRNELSLGSLSLNGKNQALDPTSFLYGINSAQLGSVPDWSRQSLGSHSFGVENQNMGISGLGSPVEMTSQGSSVQDWNQNQQRQCNLQDLINVSYLQSGFRQPDLGLGSVPEGQVLEPREFYEKVPTPHSAQQAEPSTLPLLDNQQPDLALQL